MKSYQDGFMVVSEDGIILDISSKDPREKYHDYQFKDLSGYAIVPGFVDIHNHLPQYAFAGIGEKSLLPWLEKYTFPREKRFADDNVAKRASEIFFRDCLQNGTTTTVTYVTTHKSATNIAFEVASKIGIRAFIGKVMMDQNSPDSLIEESDKSIQESLDLIEKWHGYNNRLFYIFTPRFAISCSFDLMREVGVIAKERDLYIQTHLSENQDEIATVQKLFPNSISYTDLYNQAELLGQKSIMAHAIHLTQSELDMIIDTQTKIAHCPTSNRFLGSGIMPLKKYMDRGIDIGLGTDVAGGYSLSIIHEMREAIENSKTLSYFSNSSSVITIVEAFYLATLGGAKVLNMDDQIGSLEIGKKADFVLIDYMHLNEMAEEYSTSEEILSRIIYRLEQNSIREVYIEGQRVFSAS